jgi:uncharacterized protein (TIGR03435 family)
MRLFCAIVTMLAALHGQTFEVASIKPAPPPDPSGMTMRISGGPGGGDPGLFICENCSISMLVMSAYKINNYQYSGPEWADSERFFVSAKIPEGATKEQFQRMQQNLLADRFRLKFHYEKKEMPQYVLSVAKNGPKLKKSAEDSAEPRSSAFSLNVGTGHFVMHSDGTSMEALASQLSGQLRQPITDATELKGRYDISLSWAMNDADTSAPTMVQAVQEQLGLKLEKKKVQIDVLTVDHVEKAPTEN